MLEEMNNPNVIAAAELLSGKKKTIAASSKKVQPI